jgi:hypothetical protein
VYIQSLYTEIVDEIVHGIVRQVDPNFQSLFLPDQSFNQISSSTVPGSPCFESIVEHVFPMIQEF